MSRFVEPVTLTGAQWVSLEPLCDAHVPEITAAAADVRELWFTSAPSPETAPSWVSRMVAMQAADEGVTYVIRRRSDSVVVGSSSLRTHFFNHVSRAAIERLGAKLDGVLRCHQLLADGSRRDTVVYSILDIEWPAVRSNLKFRLSRHG